MVSYYDSIGKELIKSKSKHHHRNHNDKENNLALCSSYLIGSWNVPSILQSFTIFPRKI